MDWVSMYTVGLGIVVRYCDTGYNNSIQGHAEAFTSPFEDGYGIFESADFGDPFKLKSMIAASAWNGEEGFTFNSYSYRHGQLKMKASVYIDVSQGAQTINFGNYGKDFKNIVAVNILTGVVRNGHPGSYCYEGFGTYNYQMAFDNVKVVFANGIPAHGTAHHALLPVQLLHHQHRGTISGPATHGGSAQHSGASHEGTHAAHHADRGYHSQLMSLDVDGHDLTARFHLPVEEHFGS
jgi:hypothetical protein